MVEVLLERIKTAGDYLGVSRRELMFEILKFYRNSDSDGIKSLFEAYKDWELKNNNGRKRDEEIIDLAKENLDFVCRVADDFLDIGDEDSAVIKAAMQDDTYIGQVRKFYRTLIDYKHINPILN